MTREELRVQAKLNMRRAPVHQQQLATLALAAGGRDACQVCGDPENVGFYYWNSRGLAKSVGQLCGDCAKIQQKMFGLNDLVIHVTPDEET